MAMNKYQLIEAIQREEDRVWGADGFQGEERESRWLQAHYGISTEDDDLWVRIQQYESDQLPLTDTMDHELMHSLEDTFGVVMFLEELLRKYQSSTDVYPRPK